MKLAAYLVVDIKVSDPVKMAEYRDLAAVAVNKFGGRYLVRGGKTEILEGDWLPERLVVLEFPSPEAARNFYASPDYLAARKAREGAGHFDMLLIEGYQA